QAEDGIRDFHVTGVQTCALPIYQQLPWLCPRQAGGECLEVLSSVRDHLAGVVDGAVDRPDERGGVEAQPVAAELLQPQLGAVVRSEERRVGKEWRSEGSTDHDKR